MFLVVFNEKFSWVMGPLFGPAGAHAYSKSGQVAPSAVKFDQKSLI